MYLDGFSDVNIFDLNKPSQISGYRLKINIFSQCIQLRAFQKFTL